MLPSISVDDIHGTLVPHIPRTHRNRAESHWEPSFGVKAASAKTLQRKMRDRIPIFEFSLVAPARLTRIKKERERQREKPNEAADTVSGTPVV